MSIRPTLARYVCFYACTMILTMGIATLAMTAFVWRPSSNDTFLQVAMMVAYFAGKYGQIAAIPSMVMGYPIWVAVASGFRSRGDSWSFAISMASVASLWVGIVVMWLTLSLVGGHWPNPVKTIILAIFNPLNLLLFPVSGAVGWLVARAFFIEQRD